jgi:hypothetical protein
MYTVEFIIPQGTPAFPSYIGPYIIRSIFLSNVFGKRFDMVNILGHTRRIRRRSSEQSDIFAANTVTIVDLYR